MTFTGRMPAVRPPTLRDVAEAASVHVATASRALNPDTRSLVSSTTAERVLQAAKALDYRPNPIARSLRTARTDTVGLVIPDLTNPLVPPMVRGVADVLTPAGYDAWIVNTDNDPDREIAQIESLRDKQVDGLIVATARLEHPWLEQLHDEGVRIVLANRLLGAGRIPSVTADNAAGSALAVEHLAGLGHRRIAHVSGPQTLSTGLVRRRGYLQAIRDRGLPEDPELLVTCAAWTEQEGARAVGELLDSGVRVHRRRRRARPRGPGCLRRADRAGPVLPGGRERRRVQRHAVHGQDAPRPDHGPGRPLRDRRRGRAAPARRLHRPRAPGPRRPPAAHVGDPVLDRATGVTVPAA